MPALGDRFRAAREARGLSLSDVAEQIRIRSIYLGAIEEENWKTIGAPVYIRGFLRTYARFLGLDPEEIVAVFNGEIPPAPGLVATPHGETRVATSSIEPKQGGGLGPLVWAAGVVAVALVAFVVYNELTMHRIAPHAVVAAPQPSVTIAYATPDDGTGAEPSPEVSASGPLFALAGTPCPSPPASALPMTASASPHPNASATASPVPCQSAPPVALSALGPNTLALVLSASSWLRVTVDGSVSMEGTFPAGTAKAFHGKAALVRVGNAGGVQIFVDGKDVGKLGKSGDVVDRSFAL